MARASKAVKPETGKVRVHETRIYEEPIGETIDVSEEDIEEISVNPIEEFLRGLSTERQLTLNVYVLPKFAQDGKYGSRSAERSFVTSFAFTSEDVDNYQQRVQYSYPQGGMFHFDLRERGLVVRQWAEPISPLPGYQPGAPAGYQPPVINVNNPRQPQAASEPQKPFEGVKEAFGLLREMGETMKAVMPTPQPVAVSNEHEPASLKDQILEKVVLQAFTGSDVPADRFDKVISALGGGPPEPSVWDTLVQAAAPHLGNIFTQIAPGLNALLFRVAGVGTAQPPQPMTATTSGVQTPSEAQQPAIDAPPVDPAQRAWTRVLNRLLDDMFYHVQLLNEGANGVDVSSSAEAVYDLLGRFNTHPVIQPTIAALLTLPPDQVIDLCVNFVPNELAPRLVALKGEPPSEPLPEGQEPVLSPACLWLVELQERTKEIIAEADSNVEGDEPNETEKRD